MDEAGSSIAGDCFSFGIPSSKTSHICSNDPTILVATAHAAVLFLGNCPSR